MRKYISLLLSLSILFLSYSVSFAQSKFEGKIKFKITHDDDEMFLDYFIKGNSLRMEMGEEANAVMIRNKGKSTILMPEEKMYMNLDNSILTKLPGMSKSAENNNENNREDFDINKYKTGKIKSILGYDCMQWIFKDEEEDDEVEAWVTDQLGNFIFLQSPMGGGFSPEWSSSVKNNGFFPLLVITRDEDGEENSRFEATEINKEKLNNKLFSPPSNYSEMKIPGMDKLFK